VCRSAGGYGVDDQWLDNKRQSAQRTAVGDLEARFEWAGTVNWA